MYLRLDCKPTSLVLVLLLYFGLLPLTHAHCCRMDCIAPASFTQCAVKVGFLQQG